MNIFLIVLETILVIIFIATSVLLFFNFKQRKKNKLKEQMERIKNDQFFYHCLEMNADLKKINYLRRKNINPQNFQKLFEQYEILKQKHESLCDKIEKFKSKFDKKIFSKKEIEEHQEILNNLKYEHKLLQEELKKNIALFFKSIDYLNQQTSKLIKNLPEIKKEFEKNFDYFEHDAKSMEEILNQININVNVLRNKNIDQNSSKEIAFIFKKTQKLIINFLIYLNVSREINTEIFISLPKKINSFYDFFDKNKVKVHPNFAILIFNFKKDVEKKWKQLLTFYKNDFNIIKSEESIKNIYADIQYWEEKLKQEIDSYAFIEKNKNKIKKMHNQLVKEINAISNDFLNNENNIEIWNKIKNEYLNLMKIKWNNENITYKSQLIEIKSYLFQLVKIKDLINLIFKNNQKIKIYETILSNQFEQVKNILENIFLDNKNLNLILDNWEIKKLEKAQNYLLKILNLKIINSKKLFIEIESFLKFLTNECQSIFLKFVLQKYLKQIFVYLNVERSTNSKLNATIRISEKQYMEGMYQESLLTIYNFLEKR